jgi:hypothetical protein
MCPVCAAGFGGHQADELAGHTGYTEWRGENLFEGYDRGGNIPRRYAVQKFRPERITSMSVWPLEQEIFLAFP